MDEFSAELRERMTAARGHLRIAQASGDLDAERIYSGELDSLLRLALESGVTVPPERTDDQA